MSTNIGSFTEHAFPTRTIKYWKSWWFVYFLRPLYPSYRQFVLIIYSPSFASLTLAKLNQTISLSSSSLSSRHHQCHCHHLSGYKIKENNLTTLFLDHCSTLQKTGAERVKTQWPINVGDEWTLRYNFAVAKSELSSWGDIIQNIKLVNANFDIGHQYSKYEIQNTKYKKSELKSWGNIMQNIKLVGANFDIGHQYSRPASHTFFQYHIMHPINLLIITCTSLLYNVHLDTKYPIMQLINFLILRVIHYCTIQYKVSYYAAH